MKSFFVFLLLTFSCVSFSQKQTQTIGFAENKGQIVDQKGKSNTAVKYLLNTNGLNVQLRKKGFSYDVYETKKRALTSKEQKSNATLLPKEDNLKNQDYKLEYRYHRIDIDFVNANTDVKLLAEGKSTDYDNYYNVASKPEGVLDVHKFQKITYLDIYPNIDVVFFIPDDKAKPVEYNFVIKPNGKIDDIQLKFTGAKTELADNKIKMNVRFGVMEETLPMSWVENGKDKKEVTIGYKKISRNVYGFVSDENIGNKKVIIDPTPNRLWGTYFGGEGGDHIFQTEIDSNGLLYAAGESWSFTVIATAGSHQDHLWPWSSSSLVNSDCFVGKFDSNGNRIWGTYLGGNVQDNIGGLAIDKLNNIVVTGTTNSNLNGLTTPGAYQVALHFIYDGNPNNFDAFLVKLNPAGQMVWGTLYGGNLTDTSNAVAVDELNNIVIGGITYSMADIATPGAHKTVFNNEFNSQYDIYLTKFNANGQRIYGTYFGGDMQEQIKDLKIDVNNNIYLTGVAYSLNGIATPGSFQSTRDANWDGFLAKFSGSGVQIWGTYLGGESEDYFSKITLGTNSIYAIGKTASDLNVASPGAYITTSPNASNSGYDGMMAKFDLDGHRLWSTYFYEPLADLDLDANDNIYAVGYTQRDINVATANAYDNTREIGDAFIQKFNTNGFRVWGTYYGGSSFDEAFTISFDKVNTIFYVAGDTSSSNAIGSPGAFQVNQSGFSEDGFIAKFQDCLSAPIVNALPDICIGDNINLTASGGTNYSWTGPNSFASNQQNPIILNATASHSGQYFCTITGTGGCDGTISTNIVVGDTTKPVPDLTTLPAISGDCTTIVSAIPTATDICAGSINGTTTNPLSYSLPGSYTITWNYNDGNGNIETQTQNVVITAVSLPTITSPQRFCIQQSATISNITITGVGIKWYDAPTGGNLLTSTTPLLDGVTYYASQTVSGCESLRAPVAIQIQNTTAPAGSNQSICAAQNPTLDDITITGTTIKWFATSASTVELLSSTPLVDGTTYYASQTVNGCESTLRTPILVTLIYSLNAANYATTVCDDGNDGTESVTLSDYDSFLISPTVGNTFTYYKSLNGAENQIAAEQFTVSHSVITGLNTIYVRIDSSNGCYQVVELQLTLVKVPTVTIPDEVILCEKERITVSAGTGFDSYVWSTGAGSNTITITQAGNYSVTVTQNHGSVVCSTTKNFTVVLSNAPVITSIDTVDWTDNQNSITVNVSGLGDYEYSIDGVNFQDSNVFNGLLNGDYTVTVKDKNKCGIATEQVFLLNYPKFFSPNGDGTHDVWSIKFSQFEPNFEVRIFDRYGKLLKVMNNREAWDGNFNGKALPSDDYWFNVIRNDGRIHKGHFALVR